MTPKAPTHDEYRDCIQACLDCVTACEACQQACLAMPAAAQMADCIRLNRDCADLCLLAFSWMSRGTHLATLLCETCGIVCDYCASECENHQVGHCQACAEACRHCAAVCRSVAGGALPASAISIGVLG
jgi:hypothetical protein